MQKVVGILGPGWRFFWRHASGFFFLGIILFGALSIHALRANNQEMVRLRQAVFDADEKNGDVEGALRELSTYVYEHMNTGLSSGTNPVKPPIQLKYTYERLQAQKQQQMTQINAQAYNDSVRACAVQGAVESELVTCVNQQLAQRGIIVDSVPDAMYKFDFVSARWSPDVAGLSLLATALCIVGFVLNSFISWARQIKKRRTLRRQLR